MGDRYFSSMPITAPHSEIRDSHRHAAPSPRNLRNFTQGCPPTTYEAGPVEGARGNETFGHGPSPADCAMAAGNRSNLNPCWANADRTARLNGAFSPGHGPVTAFGAMCPPEQEEAPLTLDHQTRR